MNITQLKKLQKKNDFKELIISSTSDCINGHVIVICEKADHEFETITHNRKLLGYLLKNEDQLKDTTVINKICLAYGLNYIFDINKKPLYTIKRKETRKVTKQQFEEFQNVIQLNNATEKLKKELTDKIVAKYGKVTKENFNHLKEESKKLGFESIVKQSYGEYRKAFENFIKKHSFNPYDFELVLL